MKKSKKQTILNVLSDNISGFLYYDRKEDGGLGVGDIERAVIHGEITIDEMVNEFRAILTESVRDVEEEREAPSEDEGYF